VRESRVEAKRGPLHERHVEREVKDGPPSEAGAGLKNMSSGRLMAGTNGRRRLHFLLSNVSSVDLRSTDVTLFT
jgi:hypothetical protein